MYVVTYYPMPCGMGAIIERGHNMAITIRKNNNISKSVADLTTASELEKSMRGLVNNQAREYVKTGMAVKNSQKTVDGNIRHNCDVDPFRGLALPMTSPKDIFNFLGNDGFCIREDMFTPESVNKDPLSVMTFIKDGKKIYILQNTFCNTLKQLITRYTTLSDRKELNIDNRIDAFCTDVWFDCVVCLGGPHANETLNELEVRAWVNKTLAEEKAKDEWE